MSLVHFLNVNEGDCSIIQHNSGRVTIMDVCNASQPDVVKEVVMKILAKKEVGVLGNFKQKYYPVNPISYMKDHGITDVHRFILTHPDMDHMDGIEDFFDAFSPANFWDTDNKETKDFKNGSNGKYKESDWHFYLKMRDGKPKEDPKRLTLFAGERGKLWAQNEPGKYGDGIEILAPTKVLVNEANDSGDYNDCSYALLYRVEEFRVLFAGDSHDLTWEHILSNHEKDVTAVDLLIAPHHGRHSDRSFEFLDVVKPSLTLFGNADSEDLAYSAWNDRDLLKITNNQAGCILTEFAGKTMNVYATCEAFSRSFNSETYASTEHDGYYFLGSITK
jgi:competence protein ComEC